MQLSRLRVRIQEDIRNKKFWFSLREFHDMFVLGGEIIGVRMSGWFYL